MPLNAAVLASYILTCFFQRKLVSVVWIVIVTNNNNVWTWIVTIGWRAVSAASWKSTTPSKWRFQVYYVFSQEWICAGKGVIILICSNISNVLSWFKHCCFIIIWCGIARILIGALRIGIGVCASAAWG